MSISPLYPLTLMLRREYISYTVTYMYYFFIRASVMLFVLRLLPSYKIWQQRVVALAFLINFLVTAYTCITLGISCIPFKANWDSVPNPKCFSIDVVVITNQINGGEIYLFHCVGKRIFG